MGLCILYTIMCIKLSKLRYLSKHSKKNKILRQLQKVFVTITFTLGCLSILIFVKITKFAFQEKPDYVFLLLSILIMLNIILVKIEICYTFFKFNFQIHLAT